MGLCGCIGGNRVQQDPDVKKSYLGPRGYEKTLPSARDVDLHAYFWPAEGKPRAIVQLLHGNNTYTEFDFLKFKAAGQPHDFEGSWVETMNSRGYAVCGFDFQGFGRSKGTRAYVNRFEDYVDDAIHVARHVRTAKEGSFSHEGLPYFLVGYGLGGLFGVAASLRQPGWFSGMLLISPLLVMPRKVRESGRAWLRVLNRVAPRAGVTNATDEDPMDWVKDALEQDPLVHSGKARARSVVQLLAATDRLGSEEGDPPGLGCVTVPLLVFQADRDPVAEPEGAQMLLDRAATHDKKLRPVPLTGHALIKDEANSAKLLDEAITWLDEHCRTDRTRGLFRHAPSEDDPPLPKREKVDKQVEEKPDAGDKVAAGGPSEEAILPGAVNGGKEDDDPEVLREVSLSAGNDDAAARMAAAALGDEPGGSAAGSRRSRGSNFPSESAKEVDLDEEGFVQERQPSDDDDGDLPLPPLDPTPPAQRRSLEPHGSGRSSGRLSLSPYDRRDEQEGQDGMPDRRADSAEMDAARRFGGASPPLGGESSGLMGPYGARSRNGLLSGGSHDGDNDPFAPRPPSPRPPPSGMAPLHPPSSLPPLGSSRFAPLPPINFGPR